MNRLRPLLCCLACVASAVSACRAAGSDEFLPPALPWHGASEALVAPADHPWITPAEQTGLHDSPGYDETVAWLRRLADASPLVTVYTFGRTPQGRDLVLVVATKAHAATPEALRAAGKPTLLAQAGIHAGEIDGKDAGMMLLRDIAFGGKDTLLDGANLLFIPMVNPDGHERRSRWNRPNQRGPVHQGWRTTAQNLNLNRDFVKADAPEMRALLGVLNEWRPTLCLDIHVTDGVDYQYDITFGFNGDWDTFAWSPRIAAWLGAQFRPAVTQALRQAGHIPGPLVFAVDDRNLSAGVGAGTGAPRFSQGYGDIRHLATVLVENHSLKPHHQRVLGTHVLLEAALRVLAERGGELREATEADQAARPNTLPIEFKPAVGPPREWKDFLGIASEEHLSPASGAKEVRWLGRPVVLPTVPVLAREPARSLPRPRAYWVPATKPDVIDRLRAHGVQMETLTAARTLELEMYRLADVKPAATPYEARQRIEAIVRREQRTETFPPGSVRIACNQPLGDLAMIMLEPECPDSLLAWGFFPEILQRTEYIEGYVIAPMAERMLASDPVLKAGFEAKLAKEPAFAADTNARLQWFYARSPYYDERYLLYPVGVER